MQKVYYLRAKKYLRSEKILRPTDALKNPAKKIMNLYLFKERAEGNGH